MDRLKFPEGIESSLREQLQKKCQATGSLVETVAHQIQEEGETLQKMAERFFPADKNRILATQGYIEVGEVFLQIVREIRMGVDNPRTSLLKLDPRGIGVLTMLLGEINIKSNDPEEKSRYEGRFAGISRYQELVIDLIARGVPTDVV